MSRDYDRFRRDLRGAMGAMRKLGREAARGAAESVAADARATVPKRTGKLASTIRVTGAKGGGAAVKAGDRTTEYTGAVEFGTRNMPARPFFRAAAERGRRLWERLSDKMHEQIMRLLADR